MKKLSKIVCLLMVLVFEYWDAGEWKAQPRYTATEDGKTRYSLDVYDYDSKTSITFYNIAGREADCGGRLFSLVAYEPDDDSYKGLPHYSVVGESGGKVYVAEYPSDVQADVEVEEHMKQYETVYAEVNKIEAKAADSPLVLK